MVIVKLCQFGNSQASGTWRSWPRRLSDRDSWGLSPPTDMSWPILRALCSLRESKKERTSRLLHSSPKWQQHLQLLRCGVVGATALWRGAGQNVVVTALVFRISSGMSSKFMAHVRHSPPFWQMDLSLLGAIQTLVATVLQCNINSRTYSKFRPRMVRLPPFWQMDLLLHGAIQAVVVPLPCKPVSKMYCKFMPYLSHLPPFGGWIDDYLGQARNLWWLHLPRSCFRFLVWAAKVHCRSTHDMRGKEVWVSHMIKQRLKIYVYIYVYPVAYSGINCSGDRHPIRYITKLERHSAQIILVFLWIISSRFLQSNLDGSLQS